MEVILDLDIMKIYNDSEFNKRNYTSLGRNDALQGMWFFGYSSGSMASMSKELAREPQIQQRPKKAMSKTYIMTLL